MRGDEKFRQMQGGYVLAKGENHVVENIKQCFLCTLSGAYMM